MSFKARWETIRKNSFIRAVTVLVGGTALAQGITVAALPLLTRLYSPEDFGVLAVYASLLAIFSVIACLRLEIAIPLPDLDEDAANLLALSLISAAAFGLTLLLFAGIWSMWGSDFVERKPFESYIWLLPPAVWLAGTYNAVQFWAVRKKDFKSVTRTRVTQSSYGAVTQLGMGWFGSGAIGLLVGLLVSSGSGVLKLMQNLWRIDRVAMQSIHRKSMLRLLKAYERFPRYSVLESLANNAGIHLPMLLIASLSIGPEAGYLLLAMRATAIPLSLIGGAVAQVFLSNAANKFRDGELRQFTASTFGGLLKSGVGPLLFLGIVAQKICPIVLGDGWERVGVLITYMTPWMVFQFLASPISMIMHVTHRQRGMLYLTGVGLFVRVGAVIFAMNFNSTNIAIFYSFASAIFYLICNFIFLKASGMDARDVWSLVRKTIPMVVAWVLFGCVVVYLLGVLN